MKKWNCVLSIPGDAIYLREQVAIAKTTADRLGVELQVVDAEMDPVNQGQQLLKFVQAPAAERPHGILLEPVSAAGLPRVAEAAVAAGIGWLVSNAQVDYLATLRKNAKAPVFQVSQDHVEVGRIQGRQMGAILPEGGTVLYLRGPSMSSIAIKAIRGPGQRQTQKCGGEEREGARLDGGKRLHRSFFLAESLDGEAGGNAGDRVAKCGLHFWRQKGVRDDGLTRRRRNGSRCRVRAWEFRSRSSRWWIKECFARPC